MNAPARHIIDQSVAADALRGTLSKFATGVCVVTAAGQTGPVGITINSFASVSMDPALVLWSIKKDASRRAVFENATHSSIHILHDGQEGLCRAFVKEADAFDLAPNSVDANGVPIFHDFLARLDCKMSQVMDGGDHLIFLLKVLSVSSLDRQPLVFFESQFSALR
ncbi:MAG: flavin reductase family protein [Pseudomonadota bacterium]